MTLFLTFLVFTMGFMGSHGHLGCTTDGGDAGANKPCVFPFTFFGNTYTTCTWDYHHQTDYKAWCSTSVNETGHHEGGQGLWGTCGPNCEIPSKNYTVFTIDRQPSTSTSTTTTTTTTTTKKECTTVGGPAVNKPCVFPFNFNGVTYNSCSWDMHHLADHKAWCSTEVDDDGKHKGRQGLWGNCGSDCDIPPNPHKKCTTDGGAKPNQTCVFPFIFNNVTYNSCTWEMHTLTDHKAWCSTAVYDEDHPRSGQHRGQEKMWGTCGSDCDIPPNPHDTPAKCTTDGGAVGPNKPCVFPFIFNNKTYNSCSWEMHTLTDHKAWCSTAVFDEDHPRSGQHRGQEKMWGTCGSSCPIPPNPHDTPSPSQKNVCTTVSGRDPNKPCVFPFTFRGKTYNTCTWDMHHLTGRKAWCSTYVNDTGHHQGGQGNWGACGSGCPIPPNPRDAPTRATTTKSPHTAAIFLGTLMAIAVMVILTIVLLNYLQSNHKNLLPAKLRNWQFVPKPLRSLQPYKRLLRKNGFCRPCIGDPEDERILYRTGSNVEIDGEVVF